jgi:hypothetical protein
MPKWRKDAKEFTVGVNYSDGRGYQSSIPLPVMEILGKTDTIKFIINEEDNSVQLVSGRTHLTAKPMRVNPTK